MSAARFYRRVPTGALNNPHKPHPAWTSTKTICAGRCLKRSNSGPQPQLRRQWYFSFIWVLKKFSRCYRFIQSWGGGEARCQVSAQSAINSTKVLVQQWCKCFFPRFVKEDVGRLALSALFWTILFSFLLSPPNQPVNWISEVWVNGTQVWPVGAETYCSQCPPVIDLYWLLYSASTNWWYWFMQFIADAYSGKTGRDFADKRQTKPNQTRPKKKKPQQKYYKKM